MVLLASLGVGCKAPPGSWGKGGTASNETGSGNSTGDDTADSADSGADSGETGSTPTGTGYEVGDVAYDLEGQDAAGEDWTLYGALGRPVVLVVGPLDYPTMASTAAGLPDVHTGAPGAVLALLVDRDEYSTAPDADDAARWAEELRVDAVVLDPGSALVNLWTDSSPPRTFVIDREMRIAWVGLEASTAEEILAALEGS